jgi:hypothetical protein
MKLKTICLSLYLLSLIGCQETVQESKSVSTDGDFASISYSQTTEVPKGVITPNKVETSIGTLNYMDGAPLPETAELVYENLDRMRGVDAFLKGMPAVSFRELIVGPREIGANDYNTVLIAGDLLDSKSLFLTGNTSTLYIVPVIDLKANGPLVVEIPPGLLGAFNDAWFRYIQDVGPFGQDKMKGGKFLLLPPDFDGNIPNGYYVVKSPTYKVWTFLRGSIANGLDAAVKNIQDNMKIYPLSKKDNHEPMELISISGKSFNTVHTNDFSFYEHLNEVIQEEPYESLDMETRGLFASIGMEKGKPFNPDIRMTRILTDAIAIGNATARSIVWYPRTKGSVDNMDGIQIYPDSNSAWIMAYKDKNVFFTGKDGHSMNSDARVMFHYPYTGVTPAMAVSIPGAGSDYGMAFLDANKKPFDGSKTYKLHIPADVPVNDFWAVTIYDTQTRSLLQTNQKYPTVGSQTDGFKQKEDGSFDVYFAPQPPSGNENNWLQTIPGKSWFTILRVYGPLDPWINKTWRPSEVEMVK